MNDLKSWLRHCAFSQVILTSLLALPITGCHSAFVEAEIQNRTDTPLKLIEVDYPSASFGRSGLEPNASFRYRFKIQGSGKIKLSYADTTGKPHSFQGPILEEGQEGKLSIAITPGDLVQWQSMLAKSR